MHRKGTMRKSYYRFNRTVGVAAAVRGPDPGGEKRVAILIASLPPQAAFFEASGVSRHGPRKARRLGYRAERTAFRLRTQALAELQR
jgi:hypothetical protein